MKLIKKRDDNAHTKSHRYKDAAKSGGKDKSEKDYFFPFSKDSAKVRGEEESDAAGSKQSDHASQKRGC